MTTVSDSQHLLAARAALPAQHRLLRAGEPILPTDLSWRHTSWIPADRSWDKLFDENVGFYARAADVSHPPEGYVLRPNWVAPSRDDLVWAWNKGPWRQIPASENPGFRLEDYAQLHPRAIKAPHILSATCPPSGYRLLQEGEIMRNDDLMWHTWGVAFNGPHRWLKHSDGCPTPLVEGLAFSLGAGHCPRARFVHLPLGKDITIRADKWRGPLVDSFELRWPASAFIYSAQPQDPKWFSLGPKPLPAGFYALPKGERICHGDKYFSKALSCWCSCVASVGQKVATSKAGWYARENGHGLWSGLRIKFDEAAFPTWKTNVSMRALTPKVQTTAERAAARRAYLPAQHRWLENGEKIEAGDLWWDVSSHLWKVSFNAIGNPVKDGIWIRALPASPAPAPIPPTLPIPFGYRLVADVETLAPNDLTWNDPGNGWRESTNCERACPSPGRSRSYIRPVWTLLIPSGWHQLGPTERLQDGDMTYMDLKLGWQTICNPGNLSNARECGDFADAVYIRRRPAPAPEWPCILESEHPSDRGTLALAGSATTGTIVKARGNSNPVGFRFPHEGGGWTIGPGFWKRRPDLTAIFTS